MQQVSVIVTFHNRKEYLAQCLDSVFAQTLLPSEVLIVDDASAPPHRVFLEQLANSYPTRVRVIRLDRNVGPSAARNAGTNQAKGDWIAFLDDDDLWEPSKLETQLRYLGDHPDCAAVHTAVRVFHADGSECIYDKKPNPLTLADALQAPSHVTPPSLVIAASCLRELGGFDTAFRACQDQEFFIRFVAASYRIDFMPIPLVRVRRTGQQRVAGNALRCLRYQIAIARKHHQLYTRTWGSGAVRKHIASLLSSSGPACGGVLGKAIQGVGWLLKHLPWRSYGLEGRCASPKDPGPGSRLRATSNS